MKKLLSLLTFVTLLSVSLQAATVWWCGTRYGGNGYYTNGISWKQSGVDSPYGSPPQSSDAYGLINNGNGDHITMPIVNCVVSSSDVPQMLGVGSDNPGSLTVTNDGSITANNLMVGRGGNGAGKLIISAGTMTVSGNTTIAADGTSSGIVEINNGGTFHLQNAPDFGSAAGSVINISGSASKLIIDGDVTSYNYVQNGHIAAPETGKTISEDYNSSDDQTEYTIVAEAAAILWCGTQYSGNDYYTNGLSWKQADVDSPYGTPPQSSDALGLINNDNGDHATMPIINCAVGSGDVPQLLGVGSDGSGSLTVTNGGAITVADLMVGRNASGEGKLIISAGTMTASGKTTIAADGTVSGVIEINSGGTLHLQNTPTFGSGGGSVINIYDSTSKLIIDGDTRSTGYIQSGHIVSPGTNICETYISSSNWTEYAIGTCTVQKAEIKKLYVNSNGRFLMKGDGTPFFPIADTVWEMPWKLNRQDVLDYLQTRKEQKYNIINMVSFVSENTAANVYGDQPFNTSGGQYIPTQPITTPGNDPNNSTEYDYWDHLEFIISAAQDKGIYVVLLPAWGSRIAGQWGSGVPDSNVILDVNNASNYASWISARYSHYTNIIWMLGGDRSAVYGSYDYRPVFRKMADGVLAGNSSRPLLMSYHPQKWKPNSSEWFHNDSWLSFNSIQDQPSDQIIAITHDYGLAPTKPTWLFEGGYEERTCSSGTYGDWQVRFQAYQTVFSGGFGYTYGHMSLWGISSNWKSKMQAPGANDMRNLYSLMTSMTDSQYFDLRPYQSLIDGDTGSMSGSEGFFSSCIVAMRTTTKDLAMIYSANGRNVSVKMSELANEPMRARWFDPRSGAYTLISTNIQSGTGAPIHEFDPPGSTANGNDYVLVLDLGVPEPTPPVPPYVDNQWNCGLLHCDAVVTNTWPGGSANCFITPDDNSSGRLAISPILNASNNWGIARDDSTMPTFKTNSPYSGNYLSFDGNASIIATNGWYGGDSMTLDLSFRFNGLPSLAGDNFMGLFTIVPVKAYIQNIDDLHGKILMLMYDDNNNPHFFYSTKTLDSNVWYHLSFSISNNNAQVVVGNESEGYVTDTTTIPSLTESAVTDVIIGNSYYVPSRLFKGDMDEIRWGVVIPEPATLILLGVLGLAFYRKR